MELVLSELINLEERLGTNLKKIIKNRSLKLRKLSDLCKTEQNRLAKFNAMLDALRRAENVQNRRLAIWLTEDEYERFESDWESQQQIREELKDKPDELRRYENKLHQATFNDNKAERFRKRGNKDKSTKFRNLSESHCEDALEIVDADASLKMWFDRGLDFGHGSLVDAQLGNLPRVVTSRSQDTQKTDNRLLSKREVKIATVEWAINAMLAVEPVDNEEQKQRESAQLAQFLQSPFLE